MSWFKKLFPSKINTALNDRKNTVPEGIWFKCPECHAFLYRLEFVNNQSVCPKCDYHHPISARQRLDLFLDQDHRLEIAKDVVGTDLLKFKDSKKYKDRLLQATKETGELEALVVLYGKLKSMPVVVMAFEFKFIGGSMGAGVGERFVQGVEHAIRNRCGLVCFSTSGGARMQEGLMSLFQMAKTSAALSRLADHHLPYISVLLNPTFGGVSASLSMLGDVTLAEPKALIGFAGQRVIQQTMRQVLPEGFQQSEFLRAHGFIDQIVQRRDLRDQIARLLAKFLNMPAL
jgi:acetyl-CoA carboxylase carboxyl transferase subunit beta